MSPSSPSRSKIGSSGWPTVPTSFPPIPAFSEADGPDQLFQYYLLDTMGFEPNVFTAQIPSVNDTAQLTATGGNCGLPTIGAVRLVVEPKPGLPTNPNDPGAFIDIFTDISPLFVINNESGWYEGWMIHDLVVPPVAPPRRDGHAQFGTLTSADADLLKGTLVCDTNGSAGAGNSVVVDTELVPLSPQGDADFAGDVALASVCQSEPDIAFVIRIGSGAWIANGSVRNP